MTYVVSHGCGSLSCSGSSSCELVGVGSTMLLQEIRGEEREGRERERLEYACKLKLRRRDELRLQVAGSPAVIQHAVAFLYPCSSCQRSGHCSPAISPNP